MSPKARHALEHWLDIQAREAVKRAVRVSLSKSGTAERIDKWCEAHNPTPERISGERDRALDEAARALERAELLHRKLVALPKEKQDA